LLTDSIAYQNPDVYRSKIPGYKNELFLLPVNTKMTKNILKVKKNNEESLRSYGGAVDFRSIHTRGNKSTNSKQMTLHS